MKCDIAGIWTNTDTNDKDAVIIFQKGNAVVIRGFGETPKHFLNIGVGYIEECAEEKENEPKGKLYVRWTDVPDSKGKAFGKVHETEIDIINNKKMQQFKDDLYPKGTRRKKIKSYGNWVRR